VIDYDEICQKRKISGGIEKGLVPSDQPFCIVINLGSLAQEYFAAEMCNEVNRFLVGRGKASIRIEKATGNFM
jgi:hypothetical protein